MKYACLLFAVLLFSSCWQFRKNPVIMPTMEQKVWGNKPVYAARDEAKQIGYVAQKKAIVQAGNIYAFGHYIFQVDVGRGIHVIDNTIPAQADRIGFITINGCEQISIKGAYLYTNSLADLVTLNISDPLHLAEVSRVPGAFPELMFNYPLIQPGEKGYYECPRTDSVVVGWVKDSIYAACYNN